MTPSQAAELLAFAAAFDRRTVGKADALAWHTVLADIDHDDARRAVAAHYATETRWIMPADIRQAVRAAHDEGARDIQGPGQPAQVPDADPDDVPAYLAAVRAQRHRAVRGETLTRRPVAALTAGVGRDVPAADDTRPPARGPLAVACQRCGAQPRHHCRGPASGRRMAGFHPVRIEDGRRAEAGMPPVDAAAEEREIARRIEAARRLATDTTAEEA